MACPYFDPREPWPLESWHGPSRTPLGQPWRGRCAAATDDYDPVSDDVQRQFCNFGYARGHCFRFPVDAQADAHRFSFVSRRGAFYEVIWIEERDCAPLRHELRELCVSGQVPDAETRVEWRQAHAFAIACAQGNRGHMQAHVRSEDTYE